MTWVAIYFIVGLVLCIATIRTYPDGKFSALGCIGIVLLWPYLVTCGVLKSL